MELEFTLTENDCVAFADYHVEHSPTVRRTQRVLRWGWGTGLIVLGMVLVSLGGGFGWVAAVMGAVYILAVPWWVRANTRRMTLRMYREGKNRSLFGRHRLALEADGLAWASPGSTGKTHWSAIERIGATDTHTFVYLNAVIAIVIPRASAQGDYDGFRRALQSQVLAAA